MSETRRARLARTLVWLSFGFLLVCGMHGVYGGGL